jgi:hypothetical protein
LNSDGRVVLGSTTEATVGDAGEIEGELLNRGASERLAVKFVTDGRKEPHAIVREPLPEGLDRRVPEEEEDVGDVVAALKCESH